MNYQGLMEITKIENIADDVYEMTLERSHAVWRSACSRIQPNSPSALME